MIRLSPSDAARLGLAAPKTRRKAKGEAKGGGRLFVALCASHGIPEPVREYQFAPPRRWRADWCWPGKLILEVDGGAWSGGRHVTGKGFLGDCEKLNAAAILGYRVLRVTPQQMASGEVFELLRRCLCNAP